LFKFDNCIRFFWEKVTFSKKMPCFFALQVIVRKLQVKKHDLMKLGDGAMEPQRQT